MLLIITGVLAGLCFLGIVAAAIGGNEVKKELDALTSTSSSVADATTAVPAAPPSTAADATTTPAPPTTAAPTKYSEVATLSGTGSKRGQVFALSGKARMNYKYTTDASGFGIFAPYLVKEGESLQASGGFPETTCNGACADTTQLPQKGNYYLDVNLNRPGFGRGSV